jgi:hypothetical protein
VMGWRATGLTEEEAHEQAADMNVTFNQYGQRADEDRLAVDPPIEVEVATWSIAGSSIGGSRSTKSGGGAYVVQMVIKPGSEVPILAGKGNERTAPD